jgi:hypothetical protein
VRRPHPRRRVEEAGQRGRHELDDDPPASSGIFLGTI